MDEFDVDKIAKEICRRLNLNQNIPYSYDGIDYLTAQELVKRIINKTLKESPVLDKEQNERSHSLTISVEQAQETVDGEVYNVNNTKITFDGNEQNMTELAKLLKKCPNVKLIKLIQKEKQIIV